MCLEIPTTCPYKIGDLQLETAYRVATAHRCVSYKHTRPSKNSHSSPQQKHTCRMLCRRISICMAWPRQRGTILPTSSRTCLYDFLTRSARSKRGTQREKASSKRALRVEGSCCNCSSPVRSSYILCRCTRRRDSATTLLYGMVKHGWYGQACMHDHFAFSCESL